MKYNRDENMCLLHKKPFFPPDGCLGMACLIDYGQENEIADRLNVNRFTDKEIQRMGMGTMPLRHFEYDNYCSIIPFSYKYHPKEL